MSKIKLTKRDLVSVMILALVGMMLMALGLIAVGNQPETYNDYIVETVAYFDMNMSGELKVFWIVLVVGIVGLLLLEHLLRKTKDELHEEKIPMIIKIETTLGVASLIYLVINGSAQIGITFAMIATFLNYLVNPRKQKEGLILNIITYMAIYGAMTALNWLGLGLTMNGLVIMMTAMVIDLIILSIDKRKEILNRVLMVLQIFVPLGLLAYVNERYSLNGEILKVGYSMPVRMIFGTAIVLMIGWVIYKMVKSWKKTEWSPKIVLLPTILVTFLTFSVGNVTGLVLPTDLHHTGENVISYQQIVGQGQEAYVEYSPVSGMFPMFIGGVLELIGGDMTEYNIAVAIFAMLMAGITIWLLSKHLDMDDTLIVSCCFIFTGYNRSFWMPMTLLILLLPKLIEKRNLWLKVWILIIMIQGIYYPSFGGAALIGTLPMGIWQIVRMVKEGELKKLVKTWRFYAGWLVCLIPVAICLPLILRIAKHVMLYAKQTTLADGTAVFGQATPDNFLPYLNSGLWLSLRQSLYYAARYVIPMLVVWVLIMFLIKAWKKRKENMWAVWALVALIIILTVAFSGTMVREDFGGLIGRIMSLITPAVGMILFILFKKHTINNVCNYILLGGLIGITMVNGCSPMLLMGSNETKYATVITGEYVQISQEMKDSYAKLGDGFALTSTLEMVEDYGTRAKKLLEYDENLKFIGWGELGVYYILDVPTVGQPSLYAAKDFATNQEIIDAVKEQKPVIGLYIPNITPGLLSSYYFYNWLYTTDEYVYDDNFEAFLPVELFKKIYGETAKPDEKTKSALKSTHAAKVASSLGASIKTLEENVLSEYDIVETIDEGKLDTKNNTYVYTVVLPEKISGEDADMVFIDFDVDGNVHGTAASKAEKILSKQKYNEDISVLVSWGKSDEDKQAAELGRGDLLMPLGANSNWLLGEYDKFTITIQNVDEPLKINDIKFYQLKKQ